MFISSLKSEKALNCQWRLYSHTEIWEKLKLFLFWLALARHQLSKMQYVMQYVAVNNFLLFLWSYFIYYILLSVLQIILKWIWSYLIRPTVSSLLLSPNQIKYLINLKIIRASLLRIPHSYDLTLPRMLPQILGRRECQERQKCQQSGFKDRDFSHSPVLLLLGIASV